MARSARLWPDRPALLAGERIWNYRELDDQVARAVAFLRSEGIGPEDRIAAISENAPELVVLIHAAARLDAPLALLHPRLTPSEIQGQLARIQPRVVFSSPEHAPGRALSDLSSEARGGTRGTPPALLDPSQIQTLLFTSGSSGVPKVVALTVGNHRASALASGRNLGDDPDQRWLACLPLCHVGGLAIALRAATYGASLSLMVYDTDAVAGVLARGGITHLSVVPTMLGRLIECGALAGPVTGQRVILVGGAPSDPMLLERARSLGLPVARTYGLTEAASQVTAERPGEFSGTSGRPLAGVQIRIVDAERRELPAGTIGEIEVCGATVMAGYDADPEATAEALPALPNRWLRTRDLGSLDDHGRLSVAARRSDLILSGGENIAPAEVEATLCAHPQIAEAAVFAIPHPDLGQVPLAVLVARGERPSEDSLHAWCRARLAPFKCPRQWVFVVSLPRTPIGKLDRAALRNTVTKDLV